MIRSLRSIAIAPNEVKTFCSNLNIRKFPFYFIGITIGEIEICQGIKRIARVINFHPIIIFPFIIKYSSGVARHEFIYKKRLQRRIYFIRSHRIVAVKREKNKWKEKKLSRQKANSAAIKYSK